MKNISKVQQTRAQIISLSGLLVLLLQNPRGIKFGEIYEMGEAERAVRTVVQELKKWRMLN